MVKIQKTEFITGVYMHDKSIKVTIYSKIKRLHVMPGPNIVLNPC